MTTATLAATQIGRRADAAAAPACRGSEDEEETRVLARARTGDEAAVAWLLLRYRPLVLRLAAHVLRGGGASGEAEDAAQEGFIRAFQNLPAFRGGGNGNDANSFRAYLCRITLRVCLDRRRRASWRAEVSTDDAPPAATPDAAGAADARLLVEHLLNELTPPLRAALVLREIEGLSYDEVARVLGVPVGTVRSRLSAARARFRALWLQAEQETNHV